nr:HGGxSTG domain-containing protein [Heliomarina baculiformis]
MKELGLDKGENPSPKNKRPSCGAKTRTGGQCQMKVVPGKRRCRLYGGLSTGPKRR